jgi:hypothetical protein
MFPLIFKSNMLKFNDSSVALEILCYRSSLCTHDIIQAKNLLSKAFPIGNFWHPKIYKKLRKNTSKKYMTVCLTSESVQQKINAGKLQKT